MRGGITGKAFMPGQSGNPSGRPKHRPIRDHGKTEEARERREGIEGKASQRSELAGAGDDLRFEIVHIVPPARNDGLDIAANTRDGKRE